jgi:hypothetical protein
MKRYVPKGAALTEDEKNAWIRHVETLNPCQPCSDSIRSPANYHIVYEGNAFFALAQEQYYLFDSKKAE